MMTLKGQITQLEEELSLNQQADDARYILGEYEAIRDALMDAETSIWITLGHYQVLKAIPKDIPEKMLFSKSLKEDAGNVKFALQVFTDRWQQEQHKARQGNDLANAVQGLDSLYLSCKSEVENFWHKWIGRLDVDVRLEDVLLQSQRNIPGLEKVYRDFVEARHRFRELIEHLPEDKIVINELLELHGKMVELKGKMRFDLPENVSTFFKELDAHNQNVSLVLLTPKVIEWLKENRMLEAFVVSRKSNF